jgi:hypothetical protein
MRTSLSKATSLGGLAAPDHPTSRFGLLDIRFSNRGEDEQCLTPTPVPPDVLSYDPTRPASFPSNGRTLTDDAGDAFVAVLTNGKVTEDKVGPHSDLIAGFPYVGSPHKAA